MRDFETKASGVSATFAGGATRDASAGKGRYDLVSPFGLRRLAGVYERGAERRGARNWESGMPFSRLYELAERHLQQAKIGHTDEDHLGQAAWNIFALMHFEDTGRTDLDDMPHYQTAPGVPATPGRLVQATAQTVSGTENKVLEALEFALTLGADDVSAFLHAFMRDGAQHWSDWRNYRDKPKSDTVNSGGPQSDPATLVME